MLSNTAPHMAGNSRTGMSEFLLSSLQRWDSGLACSGGSQSKVSAWNGSKFPWPLTGSRTCPRGRSVTGREALVGKVLLRRLSVALCCIECLDIEGCRPHKEGSELESGKIKCVISHGSQTSRIYNWVPIYLLDLNSPFVIFLDF